MEKSCINCKEPFAVSEMIQFADDWVCAECKETYVQKMKEGCLDEPKKKAGIRFASLVVAGSYLGVGAIAAYIIPRFTRMFVEMDLSLPILSRLIVVSGSMGCLFFLLPLAVLILAKDFHPRTRKFPNWPFMILLVVILLVTTLGLFLPLIVTIERLQ